MFFLKKKTIPTKTTPSEIILKSHSKQTISRSYHHEALVWITGYDINKHTLIAGLVSQVAGFHPIGYGIYHQHTTITPTEQENEYIVRWQTSDNCD